MKKTKKLVAIILSLVMLFGIIPTSVLAQEATTEGAGVWVGGVRVDNGATETYWLNDGEGGITADGASAKNYNVKYSQGTLTLKNANLSKFYVFEAEQSGYGEYLLNVLYAAVIYTNLENQNLTIVLEGKNTINAFVDEDEKTCYQSVGAIWNGGRYIWNSATTTIIEGKGKLEIATDEKTNLHRGKDCKGIVANNIIVQGKPTITVTESTTALSFSKMTMYNGKFELRATSRVFESGNVTVDQFRFPKVKVSENIDGEDTKNVSYAGGMTSSKYHYVKITPFSPLGALFRNTSEDLLEYLLPGPLMFVIELLMQFPITMRTLIEKIIGSLL